MYLLNGKKKHVQKHLLLANLKELHSNFLKENGVLKVGFPKFCEMRPKEHMTVTNSNSHIVYTSSHDQNFKLMVAAVGKGVIYKELMLKLICDLSNKECVLKRCHSCSMVDILKDHLCLFLKSPFLKR